MNAIETRLWNLWYGSFHALKDVSLAVPNGAVTALIGPSGCGKSTLLRSVNRINERIPSVRTSGSLSVLGADIHHPDVSLLELRKHVGMVFQRPNPLPVSIYANITFGLRLHSPSSSLRKSSLDQTVEQALRSVALWDDVKEKLHSPAIALQLEQQQKLCIARLLPLQPEILLMDEPCAALDVSGTEGVERLIRGWRGSFTTLIVTHNMAQARRVSDYCAFMLNGELVEFGPTASIFDSPADSRTADYIAGRYG